MTNSNDIRDRLAWELHMLHFHPDDRHTQEVVDLFHQDEVRMCRRAERLLKEFTIQPKLENKDNP
jgi:hypothetical protein